MTNSNSPVTIKMLNEAVEAILQGMDTFITNFRKEVKAGFAGIGARLDRVESRLDQVESRLDQVESRLDRVEIELGGVRDDIKGLTAELSDTVSRKEFNHLQSKVNKYLTT